MLEDAWGISETGAWTAWTHGVDSLKQGIETALPCAFSLQDGQVTKPCSAALAEATAWDVDGTPNDTECHMNVILMIMSDS